MSNRANRCALWVLVLSAATSLAGAAAAAQDKPALEGRVEETGIVPVSPPRQLEPMPLPVLKPKSQPQKGKIDESAPLAGAARENSLTGGIDEEDDGGPLRGGTTKPGAGPLKATVSKEQQGDPDEGDQELMVEWDRWRNRLLHAIQSGMMERLNNPDETDLRWDPRLQAMVSRFPLGTVAWFSCQVTPDKRIINAKIVHSSGFPGYDRAVLDSIHDLQGSSILRYPKNSRRTIVSQVAGIKTSDTAEFRYHQFGDVERRRTPVRN